MNSHKLWRVRFAALVAMLALVACEKAPPQYLPGAAEVPLQTRSASLRSVPIIYSVTGSIVSDERVEISSRISAYVRKLNVVEGQGVKRGDLLATLDSKDVRAAIKVAQAERDRAIAALKDAKQDLDDSEQLFARELVAQARVRKARLQWRVASERVAAAEATLSRAVSDRQYTEIVSPVSGVVVSRHRNEGDLASPGAPLVTVESDTALLFETFVSEQRVRKIRIGDSVKLHIDAVGTAMDGNVLRVVPSGNPATRGFRVKLSIPDDADLLPGMFGRARFVVGNQSVIVVPDTAMIERGGLRGVFVLDDEDRARFRWLRTEEPIADGHAIQAGLDAGERIVLDPPESLQEGDRVIGLEAMTDSTEPSAADPDAGEAAQDRHGESQA